MFSYAPLIESRAESAFRSACLVIVSSILIGLFAQISVPLPFTPIPVATQGCVILILSVLLGSKRAASAVLCFLGQGAMGFPVFAGGIGGAAVLAGPRGGYLLGYLAAAFLTGYLAERLRHRNPKNVFLILSLGTALFFFFGVPCLSAFVGWERAFLLGCLPFLLGDVIKIFAAVKILQWIGWVHPKNLS